MELSAHKIEDVHLEKQEDSQKHIPQPAKTRSVREKRGNNGKHEKRPPAVSRQPDCKDCYLKESRLHIHSLLLPFCKDENLETPSSSGKSLTRLYPEENRDRTYSSSGTPRCTFCSRATDSIIDDIITVSSLIEWETKDGRGIESITLSEYESLQISFDGRYHIEELKNSLANVINDPDAKMGFLMAARLNQVLHKLSDHFTNIFSVIASAVVALPVPIADVYMLLVVQAVLVTIIAALTGEDISVESAIKFLFSMGGTVAAVFAFRMGAHLVLGFLPGVGDTVSAVIAATGTKAIGQAAVAFYIDGVPKDKVKSIFKRANNKAKAIQAAADDESSSL